MDGFEEVIKFLSENIEGAVFAGIIGKDGLPVAVEAKEIMDKAEGSAEIANIYNTIIRACNTLKVGTLQEFFVNTDQLGFFGIPVLEDYFLVLAMHTPANIGRARLEIRRMLPKIEEMMK